MKEGLLKRGDWKYLQFVVDVGYSLLVSLHLMGMKGSVRQVEEGRGSEGGGRERGGEERGGG